MTSVYPRSEQGQVLVIVARQNQWLVGVDRCSMLVPICRLEVMPRRRTPLPIARNKEVARRVEVGPFRLGRDGRVPIYGPPLVEQLPLILLCW